MTASAFPRFAGTRPGSRAAFEKQRDRRSPFRHATSVSVPVSVKQVPRGQKGPSPFLFALALTIVRRLARRQLDAWLNRLHDRFRCWRLKVAKRHPAEIEHVASLPVRLTSSSSHHDLATIQPPVNSRLNPYSNSVNCRRLGSCSRGGVAASTRTLNTWPDDARGGAIMGQWNRSARIALQEPSPELSADNR